jgi:hypothetical protein
VLPAFAIEREMRAAPFRVFLENACAKGFFAFSKNRSLRALKSRRRSEGRRASRAPGASKACAARMRIHKSLSGFAVFSVVL